jgi:hypothetical protein
MSQGHGLKHRALPIVIASGTYVMRRVGALSSTTPSWCGSLARQFHKWRNRSGGSHRWIDLPLLIRLTDQLGNRPLLQRRTSGSFDTINARNWGMRLMPAYRVEELAAASRFMEHTPRHMRSSSLRHRCRAIGMPAGRRLIGEPLGLALRNSVVSRSRCGTPVVGNGDFAVDDQRVPCGGERLEQRGEGVRPA